MSHLDELVVSLLNTPKYRHISPDLVRRIGERELAVRRNRKAAVKATKRKLHQVGGAYFGGKVDYEKGLALLRETAVSPQKFRATCRHLMQQHASTRERLPILDDFYSTIFAHLPPIGSLIDIACGFNPLAYPWMSLAAGAEYVAYDIYADMMAFIAEFMALAGIKGQAEVRDVIGRSPLQPVDLALILKTLPCLEQIDKGATTRLLDKLNARYLLITYPVQSLGGRQKGMIASYTAHFHALSAGRNWQVQQFEFETELAFLVKTGN